MTTFAPADYLDLNRTEHRMLFDHAANVWDALKQVPSYLQFRLKPQIQGRLIGKPFVSGAVFIGRGTVIEHGAMIKGLHGLAKAVRFAMGRIFGRM